METKHTKGEWIRQDNRVFTLGKATLKSGKEVDANLFSLTVSNDNRLLTNEEIEANAKLIAAAPELLEALIEIVKLHPYAKGIDKCINAINKATK